MCNTSLMHSVGHPAQNLQLGWYPSFQVWQTPRLLPSSPQSCPSAHPIASSPSQCRNLPTAHPCVTVSHIMSKVLIYTRCDIHAKLDCITLRTLYGAVQRKKHCCVGPDLLQAPDIELRERGPVRELLDALPHGLICEDVEGAEIFPLRPQRIHNLPAEAAAGHIWRPLPKNMYWSEGYV